MTARKTTVLLCTLCSVAYTVLAVQSVSAATKGTTAFTCKKEAIPTHSFLDAHCKEGSDGGITGDYEHVAIPEGKKEEVVFSNEKTASETTTAESLILKETIAGVPFELAVAEVKGNGFAENGKAASGEHFASGTGKLVFRGVTVSAPAGKGCKVFTDEGGAKGKEGVIDTTELSATTEGQEMFLKVQPKAGEPFVRFFVECTTKVPAVEGTWEITGSVKCPTEGATVACKHTETTEQSTLKGKGVKVGLAGKLTISAVEIGACGPIYTPLTATTTETP
jgi:hypothetical protein